MITTRPLATCADCGLGYDVHVDDDHLVAETFIADTCDDCGGPVDIDEERARIEDAQEIADVMANARYDDMRENG